MNMNKAKYIWMNGDYKLWEEAQIHIMSHVIHYGSSVFEGIRCYAAKDNSVVFRLKEHMQRLNDSSKIYRMLTDMNVNQWCETVLELIRKNEMKDCYIRPIVYRGAGTLGVLPDASPVEAAIICWGWGAYLGQEALEKGIDVKISTWNRARQNTFPSMAKAGGHYMNSQLIKMEAVMDGYQEGIALDSNGLISEGSGENVFVIKNRSLITPPLCCSILPGITRDSIIQIAKFNGYDVIEQNLPREALYTADEIFLTGTAAEITPVKSVDRIEIGKGQKGPVTHELQTHFFDIIRKNREDQFNWLTDVY